MKRSLPGRVRVIGGAWRGSKLPVADASGLRPTSDRARETLFNWLQPFIQGAACADLFAGSGALGLEAASRGANLVHLVERSRALCESLEETVERLGAGSVSIHEADAFNWLRSIETSSLNVVFADPPWDQDVAELVLNTVAETGCLRPGGFLYLETPAARPAPLKPEGLIVHREKEIGEARLQLFRAAKA